MIAIERWLDRLAAALMLLGGACLVLMMMQIMLDVFLRTSVKSSIPGTEETVAAYYMIGCAFLPLAWVQRARGHVRVEVFTLWLSARAAAALEGCVFLFCAVLAAVFAYATAVKAIEMTRTGEILIGAIDVVVWPSRWFVPAGLVVLVLYLLLHGASELARASGRAGPSAAPAARVH